MLESNTGTCYISLPLCRGGSRGVWRFFEPLLSLNYFSFMGSFRKNCSNCTNRTPTPSANLNPRIKNPGFAPAMAVFATFYNRPPATICLKKTVITVTISISWIFHDFDDSNTRVHMLITNKTKQNHISQTVYYCHESKENRMKLGKQMSI